MRHIVGSVRQAFINLFFGDKANTACPALWGVVEDIVYQEAVGMCSNEVIQLLFKKDIFYVNVGIDEAQASIVCRVLQCSTNDLQHGRNTSATGNHSDSACQRAILEKALGAPNSSLVTNFQERNITRDVTLLI